MKEKIMPDVHYHHTIESNYIRCSPLFFFSPNILPFERIDTQWQCYALYKNCCYYYYYYYHYYYYYQMALFLLLKK